MLPSSAEEASIYFAQEGVSLVRLQISNPLVDVSVDRVIGLCEIPGIE
jgi:hypothetical protein